MKTVLLLIACIGCGTHYPEAPGDPVFPALTRIWINSEVPADAVVRGVKIWQDVGAYVEITTIPDGALHINPDVLIDCSPDPVAMTTWVGQDRGDEIVLRLPCFPGAGVPGSTDAIRLSVVVAHEFGHALGLHHIPQQLHAIMNPSIDLSGSPVLSDADKEEFWAIWGSFGDLPK